MLRVCHGLLSKDGQDLAGVCLDPASLRITALEDWGPLADWNQARSVSVSLSLSFLATALSVAQIRDPSFPLENTKSPRPENPGKLLKNYNLAHPEPVLKITEKLLKRVFLCNLLPKKYTVSNFFGNFSVIFRTGLGRAKL